MAIFDSYVSLPEGTPQPINSEFRLCFAFAEIFMKRGPLRKSRWAAIMRLCLNTLVVNWFISAVNHPPGKLHSGCYSIYIYIYTYVYIYIYIYI